MKKRTFSVILLLIGLLLTVNLNATNNSNGNDTVTNSNTQNTSVNQNKNASEQSSQQNLKRVSSGQTCTGTAPSSFPSNPSSSSFSMGQLGACVNPTACNATNTNLKSKIADRYCQDANKATCDANDDCLPSDCKGRVNGTASSVVLANCQNMGASLCNNAGGGVYCVCDAEVASNAQIKCGCTCTTTTLP